MSAEHRIDLPRASPSSRESQSFVGIVAESIDSMSAALTKRSTKANKSMKNGHHAHNDNDSDSDDHQPLIDATITATSTAVKTSDAGGPTVWTELPNILLLVFLYALQGVPLGLTFGSIPFLLQSHTSSYTNIGLFSLASWPYSLKLLWSPIVDVYYNDRVGRRKSWIIPMQLLIGAILIALSYSIDSLIDNAKISTLAIIFFLLIVCVATQDIAVDGWALSLLPPSLLSYASTCQSIGQNLGYFLSYSVFLALNNAGFSNNVREMFGLSVVADRGFITLSNYMHFWGLLFLVSTVYLWLVKTEAPYTKDDGESDESLMSLYKKIIRVLKLSSVKQLMLVLLTSRLAFVASDSITVLKLTEYGFPPEHLALMVFGLFPFEILFPIIVGKWASSGNALRPFVLGYPFRMVLTLAGVAVVASMPHTNGDGGTVSVAWIYYVLIFCLQLVYSLSSNVMFVSQCAFFSQVSDPRIGGTYMTLLNTVANLGSTWPKIFVFALVDAWTCKPSATDSHNGTSTDNGSSSESGCGLVPRGMDGYYPAAGLCFAIGVVWYLLMRKRVLWLGATPRSAWITE